MMVNTKLLTERIESSGLKKAAIAKKLNITRQSLYMKINNSSEFVSSEVQELCALLGITTLKEKEAIFFAKKVD